MACWRSLQTFKVKGFLAMRLWFVNIFSEVHARYIPPNIRSIGASV